MKSKIFTFILGVILIALPFHFSYGQGARYTGSYTESAAIQHVGKSNFVIEGSAFTSSSSKYLIVLYSCKNVIIRNNKFGSSPVNLAIYLDNCENITIIDNTFENVQSGMVAHNSRGIKFEYNDLTNVVGPLMGGGKIGNMAIFDKVTGPGNSISYNVCENISGQSYPEDIINVNQSHGTSESPIIVKGNWLRGGGPSSSGGGIILGDVGGSYQIAENNIVVDPGQYGISIAGGNNMILRNNKVFSSRKSYNNVGIYAANWYESLGNSYNITVTNNAVNYTNRDGVVNNFWFAGNVEPIEGKATNIYDRNLSASILPDTIIGRARLTSTTGEKVPEGGSVVPTDPVISLPNITNDPSISIYLDKYNRVCVNCQGPYAPTANILAANESGAIIYSQKLTRYHTVLPYRPAPGKYYILVRNGDKAHLKMLNIP
ncbi:MAG: right-handed parallel beta-helix repeat-containing protein [Porphyromonadaceae bacterium]|nr:right-handed parallel beta-helix repeat-containing protein [Porphyromonadaceae bacterium]